MVEQIDRRTGEISDIAQKSMPFLDQIELADHLFLVRETVVKEKMLTAQDMRIAIAEFERALAGDGGAEPSIVKRNIAVQDKGLA
jgi:hypothetical protein